MNNNTPRTTPLSEVLEPIRLLADTDVIRALPASHVWMQKLDIDDERLFDYFLFDLLVQLHRYETHLARLYPGSHGDLSPQVKSRSGAISKLRAGILSTKSISHEGFVEHFDQDFMDHLTLLEEVAFSEYSETSIDDQALNEIHARLSDLYRLVQDSDIDSELKDLLATSLSRLRTAVLGNPTNPAANIRSVLDFVLANLMRHHRLFESLSDDHSEIVSRFWEGLSELDTLIANSLSLSALTSVEQLFLLPPG